MQNFTKRMMRWVIGIALLLLVPLIFTFVGSGVDGDGWHWTFFDFIFMGLLLFVSAFTYEFLVSRTSDNKYRIAVGIAVLTAVLLVWMNAAVGIIGNEDNPVNLMYFGVVFIGFAGSFLARFEPFGMARALFATAIAQMLVPMIAFVIKKPELTFGVIKVFVLNGFFAVLWLVSGFLFRSIVSSRSQ